MRKVLLWGTGYLAGQIEINKINGDIIGYIETKKQKDMHNGKKVYALNEIPEEYDFIIIANTFANEIYDSIVEYGLDIKKVIFLNMIKQDVGFSDNVVIRDLLGESNFHLYCDDRYKWEDTFMKDDLEMYRKENKRPSFEIQDKYINPYIKDKYRMAGSVDEYFWQDLWAARLVNKSNVKEHFDIGSSVAGFVAHVLAMNIKVTMIDVRPFPAEVDRLTTITDDATSLRQIPDNSIESLSALCSLEHFGLGRYGDPVDPEACFKCFDAIQKKMKKGGHLYISVPVAKERVEFNAHRVFYASTIIDSFPEMELVEFSCAFGNSIEYNVDIHKWDNEDGFNKMCYGLFYFRKK